MNEARLKKSCFVKCPKSYFVIANVLGKHELGLTKKFVEI